MALVASYSPPAGDPIGDRIRGRAWTYDCALTATALAVRGDSRRCRRDPRPAAGAPAPGRRARRLLRSRGRRPRRALRSGNQAWVGLAALEWRAATRSARHEPLLAGLTRWLLAQREDHGLVRGGPDVSWVSTEHNLEARALFAALGAADVVAQMDLAIDAELFAGDRFRQGLGDDARPLDVQAYGILWLLGQGRTADAAAVERATDATMRVDGRRVLWPGAAGQTFSGYRPFADKWGPDVLWMEGTLMMRLAKAPQLPICSGSPASTGAWQRSLPHSVDVPARGPPCSPAARRPSGGLRPAPLRRWRTRRRSSPCVVCSSAPAPAQTMHHEQDSLTKHHPVCTWLGFGLTQHLRWALAAQHRGRQSAAGLTLRYRIRHLSTWVGISAGSSDGSARSQPGSA